MRDLPTIIGHANVLETLLQLEAQQRFPHSILFHGPKGIGKRLVAETMARRLLCGGSENTFDINTEHDFYPQILAGSCADYVVVEPEEGKQSIGIGHIRETLEQLILSSDGKRIVIVDAADHFTPEAANALLKTLEEPGKNVHFFLISHNISKLLPTIISRCRKFPLKPLKFDEAQIIIGAARPDLTEDDQAMLVKLGQGCPGQALTLGEEGLHLIQELEEFLINPENISQFCEYIHKKKQSNLALRWLQTYYAERVKGSELIDHTLYEMLHTDYTDMQEFNLNGQWVLEKTMRSVIAAS